MSMNTLKSKLEVNNIVTGRWLATPSDKPLVVDPSYTYRSGILPGNKAKPVVLEIIFIFMLIHTNWRKTQLVHVN